MRIPNPFRRSQPVEKRAGYTDSITELLLRQALGSDVDAGQTAAAEFAIGLVARCFAVAELDPMLPAVTPWYMADVGRRLQTSGNAVAALQVDRRGVTLLPASSFDIVGGPDPVTWYYRAQLPGPTRQETRTLPYASMVHVRANTDPNQPWIGISPLSRAGLSAALIARLELRMSEEANARVGYLVTHGDLSQEQITALKNDFGTMKGGVGLVKGQRNAYDSRGTPGGAADYQPERFGANIPDGNIKARREVAMDTVAALGIMPALFDSNTGTAAQEAFRQFYVATLEPLAELVRAELADKLDRPDLRVYMDRVSGSDVVRRATAYEKLVSNGIERGRAKRIAGV